MKLKLFKVSLYCFFLLLVTACKKDFIELNTNPNISEFALPQTLLAPALTNVVKSNLNFNQNINNELMQVHISMGDVEGRIFRYDIRANISTAPYNSWFIELNNFRDLYKSGSERFKIKNENSSKTYMGIALICDVWVTSLLTDTYGDVPYFEASKAKEQLFLPKFDKQEDIYKDLFKKLEEANTLLALDANLPADQLVADPLFSGNALNWRKFGNSLYLRLLLRISKKDPESINKITEIIQDNAANYPVINANAESAILKWTGTIPYDSPFATTRDADWGEKKYTEFFINNLLIWNDPRIVKWATKSDGSYGGIPGGYPIGVIPEAKSARLSNLRTEPLTGNILNYSEVQFILAEASARNWISGTAKTYYEKGISSSIELWGYTASAEYLKAPDIAWNEAGGLENKLEQIHQQKYYAMIFTDLQQWFEQRRTGHPILPQGAGHLNNGEMPSRLYYPVYLYSTNKANLDIAIAAQGPDMINTKVWWQRL